MSEEMERKMVVEHGMSQSGAEGEKAGRDLASSGPNHNDPVQQKVEEATNENIATRTI